MGMSIFRVGDKVYQEIIDDWTLVAIKMKRKTMRHDVVEIRNQWIKDSDAECCCCPDWDNQVALFYFEDRNVAFEFKMRFG